jgi:hypothetical protein
MTTADPLAASPAPVKAAAALARRGRSVRKGKGAATGRLSAAKVQTYAIRVLYVIADLDRRGRLRVLRHAARMSQVAMAAKLANEGEE